MRHALSILACTLLLAACGSHPGSSNQAGSTAAPVSPATSAAPAPSTPPASAATASATPASAAAPAAASSASAAADTSTASSGNDNTSGGLTPAELAQARSIYQQGVGKWTEGTQYFRITPPQATADSTSKIEVLEVFSWGCPACNAYHKIIDNMRKALPSFTQMDFLPAAFIPTENWPVYQRAFFTAKAMGVARKSYDAIFDATWKSGELATYNLGGQGLKPHSDWPRIEDFARFYAKHYGVDAKQFVAVANSFSVNMKMKRADELIKAYGVTGTPTFIINGMYRFTPSSAGGVAQANELTQWLAAKAALNK